MIVRLAEAGRGASSLANGLRPADRMATREADARCTTTMGATAPGAWVLPASRKQYGAAAQYMRVCHQFWAAVVLFFVLGFQPHLSQWRFPNRQADFRLR
jgi:hypothetical protein